MSTELQTLPDKTNPMSILSSAIERGIAPDQLKQIFDLQERYEQNRAREAFAADMNLCQAEMPIVAKDSRNDSTNSRYAKLETILAKIHPIYTKHGFSLSFDTEEIDRADAVRIRLDVMHKAGFTKSHRGDFPLDTTGAKGNVNKTEIHGTGSSLSYGKRYLVMMAFNITVANQDVDGQKAQPKNKTGSQIAAEKKAAEAAATAVQAGCVADPRIKELCRLVDVMKKHGLTAETWEMTLDRHGAKTEAELSPEQIESLIKKLTEKLPESERKPTAAAGTTATPAANGASVAAGNGSPAPAVVEKPAPAPGQQRQPDPLVPQPRAAAAPPTQQNKPSVPGESQSRANHPKVIELRTLVDLMKQQGLTDEQWRAALHRQGAPADVDLTDAQCDEFIAKLRTKLEVANAKLNPQQKGGPATANGQHEASTAGG